VLTPLHVPPTPDRCPVCQRGCSCPLDGSGCEHYGCWGRRPTRSCPGVRAEEDAYAAACQQRRAEEVRRLRARASWRIGVPVLGILSR
jgi:hypothetical protein